MPIIAAAFADISLSAAISLATPPISQDAY